MTLTKSFGRRLLFLFVALPCVEGCSLYASAKFGPIIDQVQDLACKMYDARQTDLGPPLPYHADQVRQIGADKFVGWLTVSRISFWQCRNLHKHIYAIGWFGDVWHLDLIAKWLDHENPEVRRCALAAFSRLTNQKFESEAAASSWWSEHNSDFPRFEPDERTLLDSNNEKEK